MKKQKAIVNCENVKLYCLPKWYINCMDQLQNSSYNKSIVRQVHIEALHKEQQQIAEAVEKAERGDGG